MGLLNTVFQYLTCSIDKFVNDWLWPWVLTMSTWHKTNVKHFLMSSWSDLKIEFDSDYDIDDVTRICHHWLRFVYKTDNNSYRKNRFRITRFILTNWIFRRIHQSINATKMNLNFIFGFLVFMAFSISVRDPWTSQWTSPLDQSMIPE